MTVHAAKGLEFPVVFIVALEQGLLPHSRAKDNESETEEERRLLFVGITRVRRNLFLSRSVIRTFQGKQQATFPSSFLRELPDDPIEVHDQSGLGGSYLPSYFGAESRRAYRGETRPAAPSGPFRITTAAELAGGGERPRDPLALPSPAELDAMQPGMAVTHPQYGLGRIVAIEGEGSRRKGRVAFAFVRASSIHARPIALTARDQEVTDGDHCDHAETRCKHRSYRHAPPGAGRPGA